MKKIVVIPVLIMGMLLVGSVAAQDSFRVFEDVENDQWFAEDVVLSSDEEIFKGHEDGSFKPSDFVNRAQLAAVVSRVYRRDIRRMRAELRAIRRFDLEDLKGSSWDQYKASAYRFPAWGLRYLVKDLSADEFDNLKDSLDVYKNDGEYSLLTNENKRFFFIRRSGSEFGNLHYGPFFDDIDRLMEEGGLTLTESDVNIDSLETDLEEESDFQKKRKVIRNVPRKLKERRDTDDGDDDSGDSSDTDGSSDSDDASGSDDNDSDGAGSDDSSDGDDSGSDSNDSDDTGDSDDSDSSSDEGSDDDTSADDEEIEVINEQDLES